MCTCLPKCEHTLPITLVEQLPFDIPAEKCREVVPVVFDDNLKLRDIRKCLLQRIAKHVKMLVVHIVLNGVSALQQVYEQFQGSLCVLHAHPHVLLEEI